jgi:hypothetical protein
MEKSFGKKEEISELLDIADNVLNQKAAENNH